MCSILPDKEAEKERSTVIVRVSDVDTSVREGSTSEGVWTLVALGVRL